MNSELCPHCSTVNPVGTTICEQCGIKLQDGLHDSVRSGVSVEDQEVQQPKTPESPGALQARPGCVTLVAVLIGIGAGLSALVGLIDGATMMGYGDNEGGLFTILITCAMAGLYFSIATGLWRLRNWARVAFLVLQGLGMAVGIAVLSSGVGGVLSLVGLVVGGYTFYWFAVNGEFFRPTSPSELLA